MCLVALPKFYFTFRLARIDVENPETQKSYFLGILKRPTEVLIMPFKMGFFCDYLTQIRAKQSGEAKREKFLIIQKKTKKRSTQLSADLLGILRFLD